MKDEQKVELTGRACLKGFQELGTVCSKALRHGRWWHWGAGDGEWFKLRDV